MMNKPGLKTLIAFGWFLFGQQALAQYVPEDSVKKDTTIYVPSSKRSADEPQSSSGFDTDKLVPGGNFAASFGNPYYVDISPMLGYMVTPKFMLGLGATYIATGGTYFNIKYSNTYYGGRILGRHRIKENFFANAELDFLNVPYFLSDTTTQRLRKWLVSPLIGASYVVPFGTRGGVQITALYNLNYQQRYSPYNSALLFRIGFFL